MKVVFRADASLQIGSGHVMRCLTLADALKAEGAECHFICREHPGHLLDLIRSKGFTVHSLSTGGFSRLQDQVGIQPAYAGWLGATQAQDSASCSEILERMAPDWLVVDHYALDVEWESSLRKNFSRLLVIDDLANRRHECEILLDQNLGHANSDYAGLVNANCDLLIGTQYALLRPEFASLREVSLDRRRTSQLQHILITMGGVDQFNATGATLEALKSCSLPRDCSISVIMGLKAPFLTDVIGLAMHMPWPTKVFSNVADMGERMASADLVIGAAGSTSWERCCLGVPTIMVVLADNQISGGCALRQSGSVMLIEHASEIPEQLPAAMLSLSFDGALKKMSESASKVVDGLGVQRVVRKMSFDNE
ncbi:UDP-2,4-diacetamido-2,4,6-trideoxy-beta-L-altropyranose hydrolase [Pseudomonas tussilaginis]|uniref:UDP-2,4-diacetamido-2,4, 6-trideoxy-beta-L-altropyranose hydrolase n=1 Tax=Pseudomonas putida TaxID=303 RepID=UPI002364A2A2|nr:UDP-2,4-diacetamido-2,4,6-trideoxy-beta-L-altropyranose hydrolase [Pseudomonas putida]MDD1976827.1 UDP-2,4-diacetamido-2,4,6-trideoxy-beta-L-altropyranose hydrolase [Pseudomonas putida]